MENVISILEFIVAFSILIILHELGHFAVSRFFNIPVDEFGLGFPPRALRLWRRQGWIRIGSTKVISPPGTRILRDIEPDTWVDATAERDDAGDYRLAKISNLDAETDELDTWRRLNPDGSLHLRGQVTESELGMLYSLNWLPFGGFVRIRGEGEPDVKGGIAAANPWVRIAIYLAGPIANLIVGVLLYAFIITQAGAPLRVGITQVAPDSPADQAGLLPGDMFLTINGEQMTNPDEVHQAIYAHLGTPIDMTLQRGDEIFSVSLTPRNPPPPDEGAIGVGMIPVLVPVKWTQILPVSVNVVYDQIVMLVTLPSKIINGSIASSEARLVGYKGMYDMYQYMSEEPEGTPPGGINLNALGFFAIISVSLGFVNLLPIPALDGGRILFALPEIVFRRPIPIEWQNAVNFIFFISLIALFLYINVLDFVNPVQFP